MSTNHHVNIARGAALSHTTFNTPAGTIDQQITDMDDGTHNLSAIKIVGGTIDGATLGGTTPGAATFTHIAATGNLYGPAWMVNMGGGGLQTVTTVTTATVEFDGEVLDSNSDFNITTYTATPTVEGWYFCVAQVFWAGAWNADKKMTCTIVGDTGDDRPTTISTQGSNSEAVMAIDIRHCNGTTDTLKVTVNNGDSASRDIQTNTFQTWFAGWRIQ